MLFQFTFDSLCLNLQLKCIQKTNLRLYAKYFLNYFLYAFICMLLTGFRLYQNFSYSFGLAILFSAQLCKWYCTLGSFSGSHKNKIREVVKVLIKLNVCFLVIMLGSYMNSFVTYKDCTQKSNTDSMKSYSILAWNYNPGSYQISE